jgi:hypothetical protein
MAIIIFDLKKSETEQLTIKRIRCWYLDLFKCRLYNYCQDRLLASAGYNFSESTKNIKLPASNR